MCFLLPVFCWEKEAFFLDLSNFLFEIFCLVVDGFEYLFVYFG